MTNTPRQPERARERGRRSGWRAAVITAASVLAVGVTVAVLASVPHGRDSPAAPVAGKEPPVVFAASSLAPAHGALLGAWVQPGGPGARAQQAAIATFEREIGRTLAINNLYMSWKGPMPSAARWDLARGTIPMISWAGTRADQVAAGTDDGWIRAEARRLKALHAPVLLRWFFEMNRTGYRPEIGSPATFVAAWRRMHRIFQRAGAINVRWVWCPSTAAFAQGTAQAYYPGNAYVDWICADGYNWGPGLPGAGWRTFSEIFRTFYLWGLPRRKPMLIGEFGTVEGPPGAKAAWFAQAEDALRTQFPQIRAVVYFESNHENFGRYFDWRATSSRSSLAAFRALALDPYFRAAPPHLGRQPSS